MTHPRSNKTGCFVLEAFNSLGTTYYFFYVYFFTEKQFGFDKSQNLLLAAALGLFYVVAAVLGGRFAQRRGNFAALKVGYGLMALTIGTGAFVHSLWVHLALMSIGMMGAAVTWPALEALASEGDPRQLPRNLGIYNLIWSALGAVAYFSGGAIIEAAGFRAMFLLPAGIHIAQFALTFWVERWPADDSEETKPNIDPPADEHAIERRRSPVSPKVFLRMAWLSNPFAYLSINTFIALVPTIAARLHLSVVGAGIVCSVWLFTRTISFLWLWLWPGWHYRFRWLVGSFVIMMASFVTMLVAPSVWILIVAQILFGLAIGLIYYSSLYYSMDVGDTKGEHGGLHEAMIGAGNCAGPAIGALALRVFPNQPSSSTWAVMGLMCCGLAGLLWLRFPFGRRE